VIHHITHFAGKPFKCDIFGKGFSSRREIVKYVRTHTREKPFVGFVGKDGIFKVQIFFLQITKFKFSNITFHILTDEKKYCVYCVESLLFLVKIFNFHILKHMTQRRIHCGQNYS
jgi:hypothetical protein